MHTVTVYRVAGAEDPEPMFRMIDLIAERELDAVTFTSAPAVAALMDAAGSTGRRDEVVAAFQADVVAACVGPVTAAAFELWGVPTIHPDRSRLGAMVRQLETELPLARCGLTPRGGRAHRCCCTATTCCSTASRCGCRRRRSRCSRRSLVNPGHVVSRRELLAALPSGTAGSEHAVEMAVARLRAGHGHPAGADRRQARLPAGGRS